MTSFCKVYGCPNAGFHVTSEHFCRLCQTKGHGPREHGNGTMMKTLEPFLKEELPASYHCQFFDCLRAPYHITEAHYCVECKKVVPCLHLTLGLPVGIRTSSPVDLVVKCPICRVTNRIPFNQPNLYHDNPALCVVCQDRNVEVFLPVCGHAKLCRLCTVKLNEQ